MFTVDEPTANAIRRAWEDGGELAGIIELRRHFPLLTDNIHAGQCLRMIAGWRAVASDALGAGKRRDDAPLSFQHHH